MSVDRCTSQCPSLRVGSTGAVSASDSYSRLGKKSCLIRLQAYSCLAEARRLPRQQEADVPVVLPGGLAAAGEAAKTPCDCREPAANADAAAGAECSLEHGFCKRSDGERSARSSIDDRRCVHAGVSRYRTRQEPGWFGCCHGAESDRSRMRSTSTDLLRHRY